MIGVLTEERKIGKLLSGERIYNVPSYQRSYSWGNKQWHSLWSDLTSVPASEQFFGFIVLAEGESKSSADSYVIVEGQQRFTTILILLAALRDRYVNADQKQRAETITQTYLHISDGENKEYRLVHETGTKTDYETIIDGSSNQHPDSPLTNAYQYFYEQLEELEMPKIRRLQQRLLEEVSVIEVVTETEEDAFRLFAPSPDRRAALDKTAQIKNIFLSAAADDPEIDFSQALKTWQAATATGDKFNETVLRQYLHNSNEVMDEDVENKGLVAAYSEVVDSRCGDNLLQFIHGLAERNYT